MALGPTYFLVARAHVGLGRIDPTTIRDGDRISGLDKYWSYGYHNVPLISEATKRRASVPRRMLENLLVAGEGEMDLSPLVDDQRVSGIVYGANPLKDAYYMLRMMFQENPASKIEGKFGGDPEVGKGIVIFVSDKAEAGTMMDLAYTEAEKVGATVALRHQYGILGYQKYVIVDDSLRSTVTNPEEFQQFLLSLVPPFLRSTLENANPVVNN